MHFPVEILFLHVSFLMFLIPIMDSYDSSEEFDIPNNKKNEKKLNFIKRPILYVGRKFKDLDQADQIIQDFSKSTLQNFIRSSHPLKPKHLNSRPNINPNFTKYNCIYICYFGQERKTRSSGIRKSKY